MRLLFLANKEPQPRALRELHVLPDKLSFTLFENSLSRGAHFHEQWHREQTDLCGQARILACAVFRPPHAATHAAKTLSTTVVFPRMTDGDTSLLEHWLPMVHGLRKEEFFCGAELQVHRNHTIRFDRCGSVTCDRMFGIIRPDEAEWHSWKLNILEALSRAYYTPIAA